MVAQLSVATLAYQATSPTRWPSWRPAIGEMRNSRMSGPRRTAKLPTSRRLGRLVLIPDAGREGEGQSSVSAPGYKRGLVELRWWLWQISAEPPVWLAAAACADYSDFALNSITQGLASSLTAPASVHWWLRLRVFPPADGKFPGQYTEHDWL